MFTLIGRVGEPAYAGKTLTQWLLDTNKDWVWIPNDAYGHIHDELWSAICDQHSVTNVPDPTSWNPPLADDVKLAVNHIGTNGLPRLVQLMASRPSRWESIRKAIAGRVPDKLGQVIYSGQFPDLPTREHAAAFDGLTILGTNAEPALPALSNQLFHGQSGLELTWAIANIGPKGIALLTDALARTDGSRRDDVALALGLKYQAARSAFPALVNCVEQGEASYEILGALGRIGGDDHRLVPALMRLLTARNSQTNLGLDADMAFLVLGLQREKARAAAPLVITEYRHLQGDTNAGGGRRFYRRILTSIAPDLESELPPRPPDEASTNCDWP